MLSLESESCMQTSTTLTADICNMLQFAFNVSIGCSQGRRDNGYLCRSFQPLQGVPERINNRPSLDVLDQGG